MTIISEEGYRGLSMRTIARRCGMSAPGLMHHFPDLPTLLLAVLDYRDERDVQATWPPGSVPNSGRELLDGMVAQMATDPQAAQLFAVLETEALDPQHPAHAYFRARHARTVEVLEPYLRESVDDSHDAARRIIAILDGLQLHWLQDPKGFDLAAHWAAIADAMLPPAPPTGS